MIDPDLVPLAAGALISDTSSAALVTGDGTIDWWCPGRFDRPASLYRLIDPVAGGAVRTGPAGSVGLGRGGRGRGDRGPGGGLGAGSPSYDEGTNVVRTRMAAADGEVEVVDFMPWPGGTERPPGRIVRLVRALRGPVEVAIEVVPGHHFGPAKKVATWSDGLVFDGLAVRSGLPPVAVPLDRDRAVWVASTTLDPGERLVVTLDDLTDDHHEPLSPDAAARLADDTSGAWRRYLEPLAYDGPYRAAVERSVLAVKALRSYATGGLVRAPTMSLPEVVGGERNFDRRFAWLADACAALGVAQQTGMVDDAEATERWLRTVLQGAELPLAAVVDVEGAPAPPEHELTLGGRRRSQPVRTGVLTGGSGAGGPGGSDGDEAATGSAGGSAAAAVELDFLGDLVAAVATASEGGPLTAVWDDLYGVADWVTDHWADPDRGVWQVRGAPQRFTASLIQCWYALEGMVRLARARNPLELATIGWKEAANSILARLPTDALGAGDALRRELSAADRPDAALLRVAWRGPWPAEHPIVQATVERVLAQLSNGPYLYRYPADVDDGLPGVPGADLVASFWAVKALAIQGQWDAAHERMEALCESSSLGLVAEAIDPLSGDLLGNYPSAAAHLALVEAALALLAGPR